MHLGEMSKSVPSDNVSTTATGSAKGSGLFTKEAAERIASAFAEGVALAIKENEAAAVSVPVKPSVARSKRAVKIGQQINKLEEKLKGILVHNRSSQKTRKTGAKPVAHAS
jgi:hypothetical protein